MQIKRFLSALLCAAMLFSLPAAAEREAVPAAAYARSTSQHAALQEQIDQICRRCGATGVSVAYVRDGQVLDTFAYGYATRNSDPMTADTKVRIASISKVMVGLAAHLSAEKGVLDLDQNMDELLGFHIRTQSSADVITPRSILTHTSSLRTQPTAGGYYEDLYAILTGADATEPIVSGSLRSWEYNNFAFYALGVAIELANGQTMDEILNAGLCDALNIDASFWGGDLRDVEHIATIYNSDRDVTLSWEQQAEVHSHGVGANGAVFAGNYHISAFDLGKIIATLAADGCYAGREILYPAVVAALEAHSDQLVPEHAFCQAQPLRWRDDMYGRGGLYYHTGSFYGEYNFISYDPERRDGVAVLSTGASGTAQYGIYAVCGEIADLLYNTDWD